MYGLIIDTVSGRSRLDKIAKKCVWSSTRLPPGRLARGCRCRAGMAAGATPRRHRAGPVRWRRGARWRHRHWPSGIGGYVFSRDCGKRLSAVRSAARLTRRGEYLFAIHSLARRHARLASTPFRHTRGTTNHYQWCLWYLQNFGNRNKRRETTENTMDKDHALEEMMGKLGECEFNLFKTHGNISVAFEEHLPNFPTRCFCELISRYL